MAYQAQNAVYILQQRGCCCQTTMCYGKTNWRGWICHDHRGVRDLVPTPVGSQGACIFNNNTDFDMKHITHPYIYTYSNTHTRSLCLLCVHKCFEGEQSAEKMSSSLSSGGHYG